MRFSALSVIFLCLYCLLSAVNCSGLKYRAGGKVEILTKPLLLIVLLVFYLLMLHLNVPSPKTQWAISTAMIFYAIGDFFMIWPKKIYLFIAGILFFALGHVWYSIFFLTLRLSHSLTAFLISLVFCALGLLLLRRKLSKTDDPMGEKMMPYGVFLAFLISSAASTVSGGRPFAAVLAIAGGVVFSLSDALIGIRTTGQSIPKGEPVMITYTAAQLMLAFGALLLQM
ncbi:MAG: lysoplasmalogenase [Spirochaetales bacterium]|nr:lysoplasmalogenase [Spirochaetales bacterium]